MADTNIVASFSADASGYVSGVENARRATRKLHAETEKIGKSLTGLDRAFRRAAGAGAFYLGTSTISRSLNSFMRASEEGQRAADSVKAAWADTFEFLSRNTFGGGGAGEKVASWFEQLGRNIKIWLDPESTWNAPPSRFVQSLDVRGAIQRGGLSTRGRSSDAFDFITEGRADALSDRAKALAALERDLLDLRRTEQKIEEDQRRSAEELTQRLAELREQELADEGLKLEEMLRQRLEFEEDMRTIAEREELRAEESAALLAEARAADRAVEEDAAAQRMAEAQRVQQTYQNAAMAVSSSWANALAAGIVAGEKFSDIMKNIASDMVQYILAEFMKLSFFWALGGIFGIPMTGTSFFGGLLKFHSGGVVPNVAGGEVPIVAQSGERITPRAESWAGEGPGRDVVLVLNGRELGRAMIDLTRTGRYPVALAGA